VAAPLLPGFLITRSRQTFGQPYVGLNLDQRRVGRSLLLRPLRVRHASNGCNGWARETALVAESFQFHAGVGGSELPVGLDLFLIAAVLSGGDLPGRVGWFIRNEGHSL
jgi:hypothetical protein